MATEDMKKSLVDYLVNTAPAPEEIVVVANEPNADLIAVEQAVLQPIQDDKSSIDNDMKNLMAKVKRIGMCAKDLHYRAKGKPFYGLHLLADLVYEVESDTDSIAEVYFMGDRETEPPLMNEVYKMAIDQKVLYPRDDKYYIGGLMYICRDTMHFIESIKKSGDIKSGVAAVLDKISEHCLLAIGILDQSLKGV